MIASKFPIEDADFKWFQGCLHLLVDSVEKVSLMVKVSNQELFCLYIDIIWLNESKVLQFFGSMCLFAARHVTELV